MIGESLRWIGLVFGILATVLAVLLICVFMGEGWTKRKSAARKNRDARSYSRLSMTIAVRIPCKTQFFTPIAYIYGRAKGNPVVTIFNQSFLKKLPDWTEVFVLEADNKFRIDIKTIKDVKTALFLYNQDIRKSWET